MRTDKNRSWIQPFNGIPNFTFVIVLMSTLYMPNVSSYDSSEIKLTQNKLNGIRVQKDTPEEFEGVAGVSFYGGMEIDISSQIASDHEIEENIVNIQSYNPAFDLDGPKISSKNIYTLYNLQRILPSSQKIIAN